MADRMQYVRGIPRKPLPEGFVLVHNFLPWRRKIGQEEFRAWTQHVDENIIPCTCAWTKDRGLTHYLPRARAEELDNVALSDAAPRRSRKMVLRKPV
jgi:hypothetical protein